MVRAVVTLPQQTKERTTRRIPMLSYSTTTSPWKTTPKKQSDDMVLSKSMGDMSGFDASQLSRSSSEIASIDHRGYLLKRSNNPYQSVSSLPNLLDEDEHDQTTTHSNALGFHSVQRVPQHLEAPSLYHTPTTAPVTIAYGKRQQPSVSSKVIINVMDEEMSSKLKTPAEQSADLLATFFGIEEKKDDDQAEVVMPILQKPRIITPTIPTLITPSSNTRSSPITFGGTATPDYQQQYRLSSPLLQQQQQRQHVNHHDTIIHRHDSAPSLGRPVPPADIVDEKDGHIWRSKYCVLEEGVLYFYRNAEDGESAEAHAERLKPPNQAPSIAADLSKSPMPRKFLADICTSVIWEKRVALDSVRHVRSAEYHYGEYAFELLAETGDPLVLRANSAQDVHEWLFQFHRSLASFMKNFMNAMGRYSQTHVVDLHRPIIMAQDTWNSSPRQRKPCLSTSLSHGHGRSGMHRRRASSKKEEESAAGSLPIHFSIEPRDIKVAQRPDKKRLMGSKETQSLLPKLQPEECEPEVASMNCPPEVERPLPATPKGKYVPPHLRNKTPKKAGGSRYVPPHLRGKAKEGGGSPGTKSLLRAVSPPMEKPLDVKGTSMPEEVKPPVQARQILASGGCADPRLVSGSIMDPAFKKRNSSKVEKSAPDSYNCYGGGLESSDKVSLRWEVGAMSEIGIRNSNEDAFLICSSASEAFGTLPGYVKQAESHWGRHDPGFFGIFDGHCGNEAARFSVERLNEYFHNEWEKSNMALPHAKDALQQALLQLDLDFCKESVEDGRAWESGTTAIVAMIIDEQLVVSNIGDCRAVICRSTKSHRSDDFYTSLHSDGWSQLEEDEEDLSAMWNKVTSGEIDDNGADILRDWHWKEMADVHSPSRADEQQRIENANGWITTEKEIPFDQLQRMDFCDEDVVELLKRCFSDRYNRSQPRSAQKKYSASPQRIVQISRVCGELAVSRAIGDRDFKADFNQQNDDNAADDTASGVDWWDCPLCLPYPKNHSRQFEGDLVSAVAESRTMMISQEEGLNDEFLVLACDGLWDVMDPDDAVRVTRGLLFEKKWPASKAAARLAELAVHLGSSDNVTVIVMRFFRGTS